MPRYFFNVRDGRDFADQVGTVLADDEVARDEAIRTSGDMLRDRGADLWSGEAWSMEVVEGERIVACLRFSGTITPPATPIISRPTQRAVLALAAAEAHLTEVQDRGSGDDRADVEDLRAAVAHRDFARAELSRLQGTKAEGSS